MLKCVQYTFGTRVRLPPPPPTLIYNNLVYYEGVYLVSTGVEKHMEFISPISVKDHLQMQTHLNQK